MEKCVYQRIIDFVSNHNILSETQFGFRTKHSTEHALMTFVDYVTFELEQGRHVLGIYVDIKKAYEDHISVNHIHISVGYHFGKLPYFGSLPKYHIAIE